MEVETSRLLLREVTIADTQIIHHLHSVAEVDQFNTLGIPENIKQTKQLVQKMVDNQKEDPRRAYQWKIISKTNGEFVGMCGIFLSLDKFKIGEIYYKLYPQYWGNGYATEVAKLLINKGFSVFNLHKVEAGVATENHRSIHVLEKCGMTREGLRRKILPIRGQWVDNFHYAIVEDDVRNY